MPRGAVLLFAVIAFAFLMIMLGNTHFITQYRNRVDTVSLDSSLRLLEIKSLVHAVREKLGDGSRESFSSVPAEIMRFESSDPSVKWRVFAYKETASGLIYLMIKSSEPDGALPDLLFPLINS